MSAVAHPAPGRTRDLATVLATACVYCGLIGAPRRFSSRFSSRASLKVSRILLAPFGYLANKVEFTPDNDSVRFNHTHKAFHQPPCSVARPRRDGVQRVVELVTRGSQSRNQTAELVEAVNIWAFGNHALLDKVLRLGFCKEHHSVDFFDMQKIIRSCRRRQNDQGGFYFSTKKRVGGRRWARNTLGCSACRFCNLVSFVISDDAVKKGTRLFDDSIGVDHALDSVQSKLAVRTPLMTNCADVTILSALFEPPSCNSASAEPASGITVVNYQEHWLKIKSDADTIRLQTAVFGRFQSFLLLVRQRVNIHKAVWRRFEGYGDRGRCGWRPAPQPRYETNQCMPRNSNPRKNTEYMSTTFGQVA